MMKIEEMPFFTQPLTRLKREGVEKLNEAELLALILGSGVEKDESAIDLANKLLKKYNFHRLADLSLNELHNEIKNEFKAAKIMSLFELFRRTNKLKKGGFNTGYFNSPKDVFNRFVDRFVPLKKEVFWVVLLDTKNKIIGEKEIFVGSLNSSLIHPREIFNYAIRESANSIVLVHNHPSGDPSPSNEDIEITKKMIDTGKMLGIQVLDHVIVGKNRYWNWLGNKL
ncbi:DNA repair protein RadC [Candidatus Woesearchaeota archaeon]|nr:DNA repair protein RadC [Candidatus Woesearchaeota archaeon]